MGSKRPISFPSRPLLAPGVEVDCFGAMSVGVVFWAGGVGGTKT